MLWLMYKSACIIYECSKKVNYNVFSRFFVGLTKKVFFFEILQYFAEILFLFNECVAEFF